MHKPARAWMAVAMLIVTAGCGPARTTVSGTVTMNGQPVSEAIIEFFPTHGDGQTSAAKTDASGHYKATVSPAEMSVTVSIPRQVKDIPQLRRPPGMSPDEWAESLPPRYSSRAKTELRVMPTPGGHTAVDFELHVDDAKN